MMETKELIFQLCGDDEQIVRSYKCFTLKRWFVPPTEGYLTITNKRVVFHSTGKSLTGNSLMINEMPLEDVAGLSVYEGLSFNWLLFLLFTGAAFMATQVAVGLLPSFLISYWFAALLILPYLLIWLLKGNILNDQLKEQVIKTLANAKLNQDLSHYQPTARILLAVGLAILAWRLAFTTIGMSFIAWLILLIIYGYIFLTTVGRRHTFSLQIGSKTMKDAGIYIPGDSLNLLFNRESTALQGLGSRPAEDAPQVIRELGALLLDIRQLGDLGIEKWKQKSI
jgi:hypothetical protein